MYHFKYPNRTESNRNITDFWWVTVEKWIHIKRETGLHVVGNFMSVLKLSSN
jgi:hypothetical protein